MPVMTDVTGCHMPKQLPTEEARIYRKILGMHCERKAEGHKCLGTMSITAHHLTLSCPLCGDARKNMDAPDVS